MIEDNGSKGAVIAALENNFQHICVLSNTGAWEISPSSDIEGDGYLRSHTLKVRKLFASKTIENNY